MPMYDFKCLNSACEDVFESFEPMDTQSIPCRTCGQPTEKVWMSHPSAVIGDECDIIQENGFRHPQHFRSKSERRRALKEAGLEEMVRHTGVPGSDRSPHTTSWSAISPGTLEGAKAMLERIAKSAEDELDDAVQAGDVSVPVDVGGKTIAITIGQTYSGVINPEDMK